MEMSKEYKTGWIPRAAAALLCMVLFSIWLLSGIAARFAAGTVASDDAGVARFDVSESGTWNQTLDAAICPDESVKYNEITVTNTSEVAVKCEITIEKLTDNVPTKIVGTEGGGASHTTTATLKPNDSTNYSFGIDWASNDRDSKYAGMVDCYKVTVTATQID